MIGWGAVLFAHPEAPFMFTFDDAYYYFEIAQRAAAGEGSTFDGLQSTNGYHPLWLAASIPVFASGFGGIAAVKALLLAQIVAWAVVSALVVRAAQLLRPERDDVLLPLVVVLLTVSGAQVTRAFVNGLESALVGLVHALLILAFVKGGDVVTRPGRAGFPSVAGVGMLTALAFLARTDAVLLWICLAAWHAWELVTAKGAQRGVIFRRLVVFWAVPVMVAGAYFGWNLVAFGHATQVSGEVKRLPAGPARLGLFASFATAALVSLWRCRSIAARRSGLVGTRRLLRTTGFYPAFCLLLVGWYQAFSAQRWLWYFAPLVLYGLFLLAAVAADLEAEARSQPGNWLRRVAPAAAVLLVPLALASVVQARNFSDPHLRSIQKANMQAGEWIGENLPPDAVLASWDAGVVGYFTPQPVVNLDGVVASWEYLEAMRRGETGPYLRRLGVGWIVNHDLVTGEPAEGRGGIARLFGEDVARDVQEVRRFPFLYAGRLQPGPDPGGLKRMAVFVWRIGTDRSRK